MFVPALIAGVKGSGAALAGAQLADLAQWLKILVAFDVMFLAAGYLLFEYVAGDASGSILMLQRPKPSAVRTMLAIFGYDNASDSKPARYE